jgi:hypothetical protein
VAIEQRGGRGIVGPRVMPRPEPAAHALVQRQRRFLCEEVAPRNQPQLGKRRPACESFPLVA